MQPAAAKAATPKTQPQKPATVVVEVPAEEKTAAAGPGDGAAQPVDDIVTAQTAPVTVNGDVSAVPPAESATPSLVAGTAAGGA